jgi:hypothetical protein
MRNSSREAAENSTTEFAPASHDTANVSFHLTLSPPAAGLSINSSSGLSSTHVRKGGEREDSTTNVPFHLPSSPPAGPLDQYVV